MDFADMMKQFSEGAVELHGDKKRPQFAIDIEALRLREAFASFVTEHTFTPGMIVRQKKQIGGYQSYGANDLAIVMKVLDEPILAEIDGGNTQSSPWYRTPLSMVIGCIVGDESFMIYHVDGRRFEPVPEDEIKALNLQ